MKSSGRNDGPLMSLEVDLRLLDVFKILAYVETALMKSCQTCVDVLVLFVLAKSAKNYSCGLNILANWLTRYIYSCN